MWSLHVVPAGRVAPVVADRAPRAAASTPTGRRIAGLDGIRGLAALFVVMNHIFLRAWPGYPADHAPFWAAEFLYGRFAVVVFIVLSGFSLGLAPARSGWRFDSIRSFARRRARRILPPYWAALAFSLLMTWFVLAQPGWAVPDGRSVVVYGLLVQDAVPAAIPNRAFWSIAVEAQLYVLLPLLLLLVRRLTGVAMVAIVSAVVVTIGLLGQHLALWHDALVRYTPDLAVLFAIGVLSARIVTADERTRSRPWAVLALGASVPVVALIAVRGSTWTIDNLFWVDLAWGPAIGCLLAAVATARPRSLVRLLDARPLRSLGSFSYSLYLTHAPIVIAVSYGLVLGRIPPGTPTFLVLAVVLLPTTIGFARLFAAVFELPFQRHRGWAPIRLAAGLRLRRLVGWGPAPITSSSGERSPFHRRRHVQDRVRLLGDLLRDHPGHQPHQTLRHEVEREGHLRGGGRALDEDEPTGGASRTGDDLELDQGRLVLLRDPVVATDRPAGRTPHGLSPDRADPGSRGEVDVGHVGPPAWLVHAVGEEREHLADGLRNGHSA
jgi:peptidoglycan/LPS O-acetylase OafA/YrhL